MSALEDWWTGDPADLVDAFATVAELLKPPAWHTRAACRGVGTSTFFASPGRPVGPEAFALCAGCEVTEECAEAGQDERDGVWGGVVRGGKAKRAA